MFLKERPISTGAMARYPYSKALEAAFEFNTKFGDPVNMSVRQGSYLDVPRECAPLGLSDERVQNFIGAINCKAGPRDEDQKQVFEKSLTLLKQGVSHIAQCPTGWGKTWLGVKLAADLGQTTLIVVPKQDLVTSWRETLIDLMGIPANQVGHIQQKVCDFKGKRFVTAMVQSLIKPEKYPEDLFKYFGLAIFDETHRMAADSFSRVCQLFYSYYRLGLSATPKRKDGKDPVLSGHIGKILVTGVKFPMKPKVLVKPTKWNIPTKDVWDSKECTYVKKPIPHGPGQMMLVTKAMASSQKRNAIIVEFVEQAYKAGRTVLILSDLLDHLQTLFQGCKRSVPAEDMGTYVSGKTPVELRQAAHKRVILATYGMCSEGTDYPHWDTLVIATPRGDIEQAAGRVLRKKEGKKEPVILDLLDADPILQGFYLGRQKYYYKVQADIVRLG